MSGLHQLIYHTTIKIATEFRNVGDAAYAMSHAAAEACAQRLAAGRGTDGYQVTGIGLQQQQLLNGRALDGRGVRCAGPAAYYYNTIAMRHGSAIMCAGEQLEANQRLRSD